LTFSKLNIGEKAIWRDVPDDQLTKEWLTH
jgi:hypothetical protein